MNKDRADFTQGSILQKLFWFMVPILGALILQAAYGAVDLLVVGRFGSTSGLGLGFGCVVFILVMTKGDVLAACFSSDAAVIQKGFEYLKGFAPETIATAVLFSMIGYFNGNQKNLWVMVQGLVQTLLVRLPLAYYMSIQPNASLTNIGLAAPASTLVGVVLNVGFYIYLNRSQKKETIGMA